MLDTVTLYPRLTLWDNIYVCVFWQPHYLHAICRRWTVYQESCASFAAPSPKVQQCKRLVWTSIFLSSEQPWPQYIYFKIRGSKTTRKSAGCGWFEAESDRCVSWSGTERNWRRNWSVAQTSRCLHLSHIFNIHCDIN